jgi:NADH-quinone oxidoreductase subunit L
MISATFILLIPLFPLVAFLICGLFGRKYFSVSSGWIATGAMILSAFLSLLVAGQYFFSSEYLSEARDAIVMYRFPWLTFSETLRIDMGVLLDPLTVMMLVVISAVSLMVHLYSISYMKGEERYATFFAFLSLFTFSMLCLVMSSNLFQVYFFWELVGVSSYLLIGFYYEKPQAAAAAKKAFIVTRFADLGFLIGILILGLGAGSFDIATLQILLTQPQSESFVFLNGISFIGISALTWALCLIFTGGAGKSAMFPLHIWLPDAMEGPTPVSALIHAATMVVAGVFLVARLFPLFHQVPAALDVVTVIGISSAFLAAVIACTQTDIKRVLAYSTMSQIGFMMFALGISGMYGEQGSGFMASQFHLFTHAFFKALLFLCAGMIIHFVHSNEISDMGGLRKLMPVTHAAFLIACLAISGIPPFAGFFSKEAILHAAYESRHPWVYYVALLTSALTAFYMFRLYFSVFWNKPFHHETHGGEGNILVKLPLLFLTAATILAGFIPFSEFVTADGKPIHAHLNILFSIAPVTVALAGMAVAWKFYGMQNSLPESFAKSMGGIYDFVRRKLMIDELYLFISRRIIFQYIGKPAAWFDKNVVNGTVNAAGQFTQFVSYLIKRIQSGHVQSYSLYFFAGILLFTIWILYSLIQ